MPADAIHGHGTSCAATTCNWPTASTSPISWARQDAVAGDRLPRHALYSNPIAQSYLNHLGQTGSKSSNNVYTFRVLYDPSQHKHLHGNGLYLHRLALHDGQRSRVELMCWHTKIATSEPAAGLFCAFARSLEGKDREGEASHRASRPRCWQLRWASRRSCAAARPGDGMEVGHSFMHRRSYRDSKEEDESDEMRPSHMLDQGYNLREVMPAYFTESEWPSTSSRMGLGFMGHAHASRSARPLHRPFVGRQASKAKMDGRAKGSRSPRTARLRAHKLRREA